MRDIFNPTFTFDRDDAQIPFAPGQRIVDHDGQEYVFVKARNTIEIARACVIDEDFDAREVLGNNAEQGEAVGISIGEIPNGDYGWLSIWGQGDLQAANGTSANVKLYTTTTAGRLDDIDVVDEVALINIVLTTARTGGGGLAPAKWRHPAITLDP